MKLKLLLLALLAPAALALSGCGKKAVAPAAPVADKVAEAPAVTPVKTVPVEAPTDIKSLGSALQSINTNILAVGDQKSEIADLKGQIVDLKKDLAKAKGENETTWYDVIIIGGAWLVVAVAGAFFMVTLAISTFPKWISGVAFGLSLFGLGLAYLADESLQHWFILPLVMVVAGLAGLAYAELKKHGVQLSFLDKAFNEIISGGEAFKDSLEASAKDGKLTVAEVKAAFQTAQMKAQSSDVQTAVQEATK